MVEGSVVDISNYETFVEDLVRMNHHDTSVVEKDIDDALNGYAYKTLRQSVSLDTRRSLGAFFTGPEICKYMIKKVRGRVLSGASVLDPACGAGDLLLQVARLLPVGPSFRETLEHWETKLFGWDTQATFVRTTKLRLLLLAKQRCGFPRVEVDLNEVFPGIQCLDALAQDTKFLGIDVVLVNPPYNQIDCPKNVDWARGKVSAAALFMAHIGSSIDDGATLFAILPEVLRCGTRYAKLRHKLGETLTLSSGKGFGLFDRWTDVHVFACELQKKKLSDGAVTTSLFETPATKSDVLGKYFDVRIGPVVAHRSPELGRWHPYLVARDATPWAAHFIVESKRRFSGTIFQPPFVVVRRTSRPGDTQRAIGTLVRGDIPVAVENHLVVLLPLDGTVSRCRSVMQVLREKSTNEFLDQQMRCRHLTVSSVKQIPWVLK